MSVRSDLLFQAHIKISNPFVLCTLISRRARQLMIPRSGRRSTAEIVNYALGELLDGALQFRMPAEKGGTKEIKVASSYLMAAARVVLGLEVRLQAGLKSQNWGKEKV